MLVFPPEYVDRFRAKISTGDESECWPWTGEHDKDGYGLFRPRKNKQRLHFRAHRVALALSGVAVPDKMVLHTCDNPPCCNPTHLYLGDAKRNGEDMKNRGRSTRTFVCPRGHDKSGDNVREYSWRGKTYFRCRACEPLRPRPTLDKIKTHSRGGYVRGCKCEICRKASLNYNRSRRFSGSEQQWPCSAPPTRWPRPARTPAPDSTAPSGT
jgi:hypothetical protein